MNLSQNPDVVGTDGQMRFYDNSIPISPGKPTPIYNNVSKCKNLLDLLCAK
jgi:hypothetical protein